MIQQLADNVEIDELAERLGLSVKRVGDKSVSLCIEHNEKNPSMQLYKKLQAIDPITTVFLATLTETYLSLYKMSKM